ncbi:class II aldolase/adducin family protein [Methylomonas sp. SURF-2]|uniref:Class II aldolase/adducin family protein n=1 Tax=Methylomonas subterranea TaxID=2952225 RepID=A0ABT1TGN7_9GAMM|nr:class II aldolase/adducin family protein [Methylomonas sp. SURF-2]MCQ8104621.1 class II aldolase/adducin family protein [Methylomonas sp. SURF-2]
MSESEGVIKYRLEHRQSPLPDAIDTGPINGWRCLLFRLGLIGQKPERYEGLGYGNISQRLAPDGNGFLISGTQTGQLAYLAPKDFAVVTGASATLNSIQSLGPSMPSSEALTHAAIYALTPSAQAVIHVHCPEIWRQTRCLGLPFTAVEIAYGSVEMNLAVEGLFASGQLHHLPLFSMLGHQDGIVAFGDSLTSAAQTLLSQLARALAIEQNRAAG